jgi:diguanylate cyclase (GGDEF)-like protein/PAS domain S-box-containing protein
MKTRLQAMVDAIPDLLFEVDLAGCIYSYHSPQNDLLAIPGPAFLGQSMDDILPPHAAAICMAALQDAALNGHSNGASYCLDQPDGPVWYELSISCVAIPEEDDSRFIILARDITARVQAEEDFRIAAAAFETQQGMLICDAKGVILKVNRAFSRITGYGPHEVTGKSPKLLASGRQDATFYTQMWADILKDGTWQGEIWNRRKGGEEYPEWLTIHAVKNEAGMTTHYVGAFSDTSSQKTAEAQIASLAYTDGLTGLSNRRHLVMQIQKLTTEARHDKHLGALLQIDLDDFKNLNDALGHEQGDMILMQVARRLKTCVRETDTVARVGGDAFALLLTHLDPQPQRATEQAELIAAKVLAALQEPYQIDADGHSGTASIGVTLLSGQHQEDIDSLLGQAELAMYEAKSAGRNAIRFFDRQMQEQVRKRVAMESGLRQSIQAGTFALAYQPQVSQHGGLIGVEALLRWQHPERGWVPPAEFIPLAEETGLILPIGHWVLQAACQQLRQWASHPVFSELTIAVNVSALQFHQDDFVDQVLSTLERTGARPERLKLELTESVLVSNVEGIIEKMAALKARGICFSMDDFGTGYSSLTFLKRLPLDQLKIDQSFVSGILTDAHDADIARMVVALSRSMGLDVIAEGVETEAQRHALADSGCLNYQGYLFGKPMDISALEDWVEPNDRIAATGN